MKRSRRWLVLACIASLAMVPLSFTREPGPADTRKDGNKPPAEKWLADVSLTVSPQPVPVPALKYQLFPLFSERKAGNAVPIYLRLVYEQNDAARRRWFETPLKWNERSLDRLPVGEARAFLKDYRRFFQQFDLGARRKTANWNYTLDQGNVIEILLPDVRTMRNYVPLLALRARADLAEGKFAAAAHALETDLAVSQHVADGAFLINGLVGIAMAAQFIHVVEEWVGWPDAPNLYWSLTALPRPLIDLRKGLEFEQRLLELQYPELADLQRLRPAEQWDALLKRLREDYKRYTTGGRGAKPPPKGTSPDDPADKAPDLAAAKKYLAERMGLAADTIKAMPPAQVMVFYLTGTTREIRDDRFKVVSLPYPQARKALAEADNRLNRAPDTEALRFALLLLPAIKKVLGSQNRLERRIAALRVVEALRLHAAAHNGQLPDKLSQVTQVPVPDDPGTGRPFEYQRNGPAATLTGRIPGEELVVTGLRYRIEVRKQP